MQFAITFRSYPNCRMLLERQLQEKYKNEPVVFLRITSLQGRVSFPYSKDLKPVGNLSEARELELLPQWNQSMDMTWTVA